MTTEKLKFSEKFEWVEVQREDDKRFYCSKCGGLLVIVPSPFAVYGTCVKCAAIFMQKTEDLFGSTAEFCQVERDIGGKCAKMRPCPEHDKQA